MAKELIGLCDCPECGNAGAQISETKAGLAMRWSPECFAQDFPKKDPQSDTLKARARPGTATGRHAAPGTVTGPEQGTGSKYEPVPVQEQKPERKTISVF